MNIVVIGSLNVDYSSQTVKLPLPGETVSAYESYISPGGKGANQAVAASRLGANVSMIGKIGLDPNGKMLLDRLKAENVNVDGISFSDNNTGNAQITVELDGLNTIVVYPGANFDLTIEDVMEHKDLLIDADVVVMQLEIKLDVVKEVVSFCSDNGIKTILNPAPAYSLPDEILKKVSYLTPNETELLEISGESNFESAIDSLLTRGVSKLIITMGSEGSMYVDKNKKILVGPYKVTAIDTTAAGDSFNAALATLLCSDLEIEEILKYANKVGAITTTTRGAIDSLPDKRVVDGTNLEF